MNKRNKMLRKAGFSFLLLLLFSALLPSQQAAASDSSRVLYQVDENYPPFTYANQNHIYGFDPDFTNLIFNTNEYHVDYSTDRWPKVYERLVKGEIDIGGIIAVTDERKKEVLFSDTVFVSYIAVYTRSDFRGITLDDIDNLSVGVGRGYYSESILKNELQMTKYTAYDDLSQAIKDLASGKIDVILENQQLMDNLLVTLKEKGSIITQISGIYPRDHAYAINKNRPDLVNYINGRMMQLKRNGVFEEIYTKYFYTHSYEYKKKEFIKIVLGSVSVIVAVSLIIFLMKLYISLLRKRLAENYTKLSVANDELSATHEELQAQYEEIQAQYEEINSHRLALEQSEERYRLVAEGASDGLFDWDIPSDRLYLSEKWAEKIGFDKPNVHDFSLKWYQYISEMDKSKVLEYYLECQEKMTDQFHFEYRLCINNGDIIWVSMKAKIIRDAKNRMVRMSGSITDINEVKQKEERIYRLAYHDFLTGIPNRVLLQEQMKRILTVPHDNCYSAIYCIDLDNFKQINDTLGHDYGDLLLKTLAKELMELKSEDYFLFRSGGDEFIAIIENISSKEEIAVWAENMNNLICQHWFIAGSEVFVTASIGITVVPDDGLNPQKLLRNADTAMYAAKEMGKGGYKFFHEDMFQKVAKRTELEADLRRALEKQEFVVYYQPYFNITDGSIAGMEALIRWFHNKKGYIPPSDFIPVAEETGMIKEIGQWVLEETCRQSKRWEHQGLRNLPIAVNVSKIQLEDRRFVTDLTRLLGDLELDPRFLQLEITESCIMKSMEHSIEKLDAIKNMGIRISLDDFGTGYSSLNYLQTLPIDIVKIDRSFVNEISRRPHNTLIINDIISIAHKSQMSVIAEGVETEDQLSYLRQENCDAMQGFYRCRPLPGKEVEQWLIR